MTARVASVPGQAQLPAAVARPLGAAGTHPGGPAGRRPAPPLRRRPQTPDELAHAVAKLLCEAESGRRPVAQLAPLLDAELYARMATVWVRRGLPPTLEAVRTWRSGHGVEAVAVVRRGKRVGAVAIRLAPTRRGWRVTELARPEDGPLPPPAWPVFPEDDEDDPLPQPPPPPHRTVLAEPHLGDAPGIG